VDPGWLDDLYKRVQDERYRKRMEKMKGEIEFKDDIKQLYENVSLLSCIFTMSGANDEKSAKRERGSDAIAKFEAAQNKGADSDR